MPNLPDGKIVLPGGKTMVKKSTAGLPLSKVFLMPCKIIYRPVNLQPVSSKKFLEPGLTPYFDMKFVVVI